MGSGGAHVSWFASRSLLPVVSWRPRQPNLPLLAWAPWSAGWAGLPGKTRGAHQRQRAYLLERLTDVAVVTHHLAFARLPLGARGASGSLRSGCSRLPLAALLSRQPGRALDTSFSLWPWGSREPRGSRLPSASSNGIARVALLSLLPQEAEEPGGACSPFLALGSWGPRLPLQPGHRDAWRPLGAVLARRAWHAPFPLPAVVALDSRVPLCSRRPRQARRPHGAWQSRGSQKATWSRRSWGAWRALDARLALFTPVWVLATLALFSFLPLRAHLSFRPGVTRPAIQSNRARKSREAAGARLTRGTAGANDGHPGVSWGPHTARHPNGAFVPREAGLPRGARWSWWALAPHRRLRGLPASP